MSNEMHVTRDNGSGVTTKPYRKGGASVKPRWNMMIMSFFTRNMVPLVILACLVQMVCVVYLTNSVSVVPGYDDMDSRVAEVEMFVKESVNMMQVQVDGVEKRVIKIKRKVSGIESELSELGRGVGEIGGGVERLEKYLSDDEMLSKAGFDEFFEKYRKGRGDGDLDEVREVARGIVMGEIEKHVADGLGRVDYALASGGGYVTRHSKAKGSVWFSGVGWNGVHVDSVKMLRPSFGEPCECFALNGSSGFVEIKLREAIVPEAFTLEHVAKSVAYSRSSAPKDCRVSGWLTGQETDCAHAADPKKFPLAEFTYDLEKSNAQTFDVSQAAGVGLVDMIRLDFTSNHGSASHTCIYRFRVHGHEPDSFVPMGKMF